MQNGAELTGLLAYLSKDDEVRAHWMAYAVAKAFGGDQKGHKKPAKQEDEEVIDTTDPEFTKKFQGFTYAKPQQRRVNRQASTEILFG